MALSKPYEVMNMKRYPCDAANVTSESTNEMDLV